MKTLHLTALLLLVAAAAVAQPVVQVGNLNPPVPPAVPDLHFGQTGYAYLIHPPDQGSCPLGGFILETVHMYLEFTPAQVPATFEALGGLTEAVWDPSRDRWVPGAPLCQGPPQTYTFTEPGLYVLDIPVNGACGCEVFDSPYFLTVQYPTFFEADLPTDGQPEPGVVFSDDGAGWVDMFAPDKTASGKVIIWGDLVCCEAVGNEFGAWGDIKSLYR